MFFHVTSFMNWSSASVNRYTCVYRRLQLLWLLAIRFWTCLGRPEENLAAQCQGFCRQQQWAYLYLASMLFNNVAIWWRKIFCSFLQICLCPLHSVSASSRAGCIGIQLRKKKMGVEVWALGKDGDIIAVICLRKCELVYALVHWLRWRPLAEQTFACDFAMGVFHLVSHSYLWRYARVGYSQSKGQKKCVHKNTATQV